MLSKILKTVLAISWLAIGSARATTWYVDSATGNDSNDGKTIGTAFVTLQKAANVTTAGDTVYILPGVGYGGGTGGVTPLVISTSGSGAGTTAGTPCTSQITYQGYTGPYAPVAAPASIPGYPRPIIASAQSPAVISGSHPLSCITVNYLEIVGQLGATTWAGASVFAGSGSTTNWVYRGATVGFLGTTGGTGSTSVHHLMMLNMVIHDFPDGGFGCAYCDYVTISGNEVYNTSNYNNYGTSGIDIYEMHNIDAGTGTKNIISGNIVYNNFQLLPTVGSIIATTTASGTTTTGSTSIVTASISGVNYGATVIDTTGGCVPPNSFVTFFAPTFIVISNPTTCTINNGAGIQVGYVTDGEGIIIDNNTNSQSDSVPYVGRTLITNNIVFNNGSAGIQIGPQSINTDVSFNTLYMNQTTWNTPSSFNDNLGGELNVLGADGLNLYNNTINPGTNVPATNNTATNTTWSNNGFFGGSGSFANPGTGNVLTNPNFVSPSINALAANFQLQSGSPLIDAGSATFTRSTDILGNPGLVGPSYDIGAYESACSPFGANTMSTLTAIIGTAFANGQAAGSITPASMRNAFVSLACGQPALAN